eukprot:Hpha_TRINITY_DN12331_c0_g1::TRINITY_DN12331_c0_g1_i2::g.155843::m.155843
MDSSAARAVLSGHSYPSARPPLALPPTGRKLNQSSVQQNAGGDAIVGTTFAPQRDQSPRLKTGRGVFTHVKGSIFNTGSLEGSASVPGAEEQIRPFCRKVVPQPSRTQRDWATGQKVRDAPVFSISQNESFSPHPLPSQRRIARSQTPQGPMRHYTQEEYAARPQGRKAYVDEPAKGVKIGTPTVSRRGGRCHTPSPRRMHWNPEYLSPHPRSPTRAIGLRCGYAENGSTTGEIIYRGDNVRQASVSPRPESIGMVRRGTDEPDILWHPKPKPRPQPSPSPGRPEGLRADYKKDDQWVMHGPQPSVPRTTIANRPEPWHLLAGKPRERHTGRRALEPEPQFDISHNSHKACAETSKPPQLRRSRRRNLV